MSDTAARPVFITVRGSQTYRVEGTDTLLSHLGVWLLNNSGSVHFVREDELAKDDSPHYASNRGANQDDRGTVAATTRGETYIDGRGLYQYRMDVFAEMMTKTAAELRAIVAGVHDGDRELNKGVSKLRKEDLAAMCAEWESGKRDDEDEYRSSREQYAGTPARFDPQVINAVHAIALIENNGRSTVEDIVSDSLIHDRELGVTLIVLGTGVDGSSLLVRNENSTANDVFVVSSARLNDGERYTALCDHGYTANDSCPGCDRDADGATALISDHGVTVSVRTFSGHTIELGMIYNNADTTWSAMSPDGVVLGTSIGTSDSAVRALTLDHKRRVWLTAAREAEVRKEARELDEHAAHYVELRKSQEIEQAVRTLIGYGVTTPKEFLSHVADVLKLDGAVAEFEAELLGPVRNCAPGRDLGTNPSVRAHQVQRGRRVSPASSIRVDQLVTGPADVWVRPIGAELPGESTRAVHQWVKTRQLGHAYGMPVAKVAPHDGSQL